MDWLETVKNDSKVVEWLTNMEASENTRKAYTNFLKIFCECNSKLPSELIQEAIKGIKSGLLPAERNEGTYISKFKDCLKKAGYADTSYFLAISAIKSFYNNYDITLPRTASKIKKANPLTSNNNFLKKEDVQKMIVNAKTLRERAIILCMASSGMAIQEIANLKVSMLSIDEQGIGTITHRRQKTNTDYITFLSPEATKALSDYHDERNRDKETAIKGKSDYVFVTNNNRSKGKQINPSVESVHFQHLGEKLGYENTENNKGRKGFVKSRSHALRKFFASTLENAGVPKSKVDYMLGHYRSNSDVAYFNMDRDVLKQLYIQYLPFLTFEKEIKVQSLRTEDEQRLAALEKENEKLKAEMAEQKKNNTAFTEEMIKAMIEARVKEMLSGKT